MTKYNCVSHFNDQEDQKVIRDRSWKIVVLSSTSSGYPFVIYYHQSMPYRFSDQIVISRLLWITIAVFIDVDSAVHLSLFIFLTVQQWHSLNRCFLIFPFLFSSLLWTFPLFLIKVINPVKYAVVHASWWFGIPVAKPPVELLQQGSFWFNRECESICWTNETDFIFQITASIIVVERQESRDGRTEQTNRGDAGVWWTVKQRKADNRTGDCFDLAAPKR